MCNGNGMAPPCEKRESKVLIVADHQEGVGTRTASLMFPEGWEGPARVKLQATTAPQVAIVIVVIFIPAHHKPVHVRADDGRTAMLTGRHQPPILNATGRSSRSDHNVAPNDNDIPRKGDVRGKGTEGRHRHGETNWGLVSSASFNWPAVSAALPHFGVAFSPEAVDNVTAGSGLTAVSCTVSCQLHDAHPAVHRESFLMADPGQLPLFNMLLRVQAPMAGWGSA
ncbi:hypothetical protein QBC45DRAFT_433757 [Copromyces sp. CBS 386.78]|nr:hypothetical protein QBC45DRAFT_433757 [Copromyces sp. CBS 386.78]